MIEADCWTARNMLRMRVQSALAIGGRGETEARICCVINGIVAPVTETLDRAHQRDQFVIAIEADFVSIWRCAIAIARDSEE